jgi:hypothetical protein
MSKRIVVFNLALLGLLVLAGVKLRRDWSAFRPAHNLASIQPAAQTFPPLAAAIVATPQAVDWTDIPSHNVFSFDRTDIDIAAVVEVEPPKPSGPKPIVVGTLIIGSQKTAFLGKNSKPVKVDDEIDGWKIVDIQRTGITIESNGQRQTVVVNDASAQLPRDGGKTALTSTASAVIQTNQNSGAQATTAVTTSGSTSNSSVLNGFTTSSTPTIFVPAGAIPATTLFGQTAVSEGVTKKP